MQLCLAAHATDDDEAVHVIAHVQLIIDARGAIVLLLNWWSVSTAIATDRHAKDKQAFYL